MAWPLYLLTFLGYLSGVVSQPTLTQPASVSVSLGGTTKLSCNISSNNCNVGWYQQTSGQGPRYVQADGYRRGPGIPDRFTASRTGNMGYLTITNVQAEDEAVYYCGMWYRSGGLTRVSGQPAVPPSVSLFPPSQEELKSKNKATLVCLMDGFHPGVVQVEWLGDGRTISSGVETTKPVQKSGKYIASSYLTLSRSEWEANESYTCKVTHESKIIEKVVSRSACS